MTDFVETNVLLAVLRGDEDEAKRLVGELLPGEKAEFLTAIYAVADILRGYHTACHRRLADDGSCPSCEWHAERTAAAEARRAEEAKREASGGK